VAHAEAHLLDEPGGELSDPVLARARHQPPKRYHPCEGTSKTGGTGGQVIELNGPGRGVNERRGAAGLVRVPGRREHAPA
jgi:hypothetical protein